jgi:tetratricopeptide (TPR) repeat protein
MMKDTGLKYIFLLSSALLLAAMLILSRNAGISCDEVLHYKQSVAVKDFFSSHGEDLSALDTPVTHLKYYGQSYDNVVTFLSEWFKIRDVYGFRHFMSSLAGWLAIFVTALFAVWLSGYRTGILVLFLFAVSPTFMGHSQNNLKDIPFALSYIAGIFLSLKLIIHRKKLVFSEIVLLLLSISFCISIRAGGLVMICYLLFFLFISLLFNRVKEGGYDLHDFSKKLVIILLISASAYFLSILLWPFALKDPVRNVIASYKVMVHFPDTFRQIFEGKAEWSDYMPWYYIPKSMAITIPFIVFAGIALFFIYTKKIFKSGKSILYGLLIFTILFPVLFAIAEKSNLYSSWRQFLFVYPAMVIISALGISFLFDSVRKKYHRWMLFAALGLLVIHPVRFMVRNHSYFYLYYNQLAGGLKGAYGNYETDYYYVGQTEASKWLNNYLDEKKIDKAFVGATFSVEWQFRNRKSIKTFYLRNEERSQQDWDYAIITNRYIPVLELKNKTWPPENSIHIIYADGVPICSVLERKTKADFYGYRALEEGRSAEAISFFEDAVKVEDDDEMIFYNFARALMNEGEYNKADSLLKIGLKINPVSEPILMYMGNIAKGRNDISGAKQYYEKVISVNRKYFQAYVELSEIITNEDVMKARQLLRECLTINPKFKPAIIALGNTYRKSDPDIAEKYDSQANKLK